MNNDEYQVNRNGMHRYLLVKADDSGKDEQVGKAQHRDVEGIDTNDKPTKVLVIQPHGFASVPKAGSHMVGFAIGDHRDNLMLIGGEHEDHMPTNLGEGNSAFYNADKTIMKLTGKDLSIDAEGNATINVKSWTFKCGGVELKIDGEGVHVKNGKIEHDSHDVGKTHKHKDTEPGGGLSGEPQ